MPPGIPLPRRIRASNREASSRTRSSPKWSSEDHVLVTWRFRVNASSRTSATSQFPFEQNDIQLSDRVPGLQQEHPASCRTSSSYDRCSNPSVRSPDSIPDITVPFLRRRSASFFTLQQTIDYNTTFGNGTPGRRAHPDPQRFNIGRRRGIFLSPFIANIVPILIVALIMFVVLCVFVQSPGQPVAEA